MYKLIILLNFIGGQEPIQMQVVQPFESASACLEDGAAMANRLNETFAVPDLKSWTVTCVPLRPASGGSERGA